MSRRLAPGLALALLLGAPVADAQTGLAVTAQAGQLTLTWQYATPTEATGFLVERSLPNDVCEFTALGGTPVETLTFVDAALPPGARWCYRVRATSATAQSEPSLVACGSVPDDAPPPIPSRDFTRPPDVSPFRVVAGAYTCERLAGGTAEVRITQGTLLLKKAVLANPPNGVMFTLSCEVTPTEVILRIDGATKLTAVR